MEHIHVLLRGATCPTDADLLFARSVSSVQRWGHCQTAWFFFHKRPTSLFTINTWQQRNDLALRLFCTKTLFQSCWQVSEIHAEAFCLCQLGIQQVLHKTQAQPGSDILKSIYIWKVGTNFIGKFSMFHVAVFSNQHYNYITIPLQLWLQEHRSSSRRESCSLCWVAGSVSWVCPVENWAIPAPRPWDLLTSSPLLTEKRKNEKTTRFYNSKQMFWKI